MTSQEIMKYNGKAEKLVAKMTLEEKLNLMAGNLGAAGALDFVKGRGYNYRPYCTKPVKRLGIPAVKFCDGPRGVVSKTSTCFPVTMGRGATFDKDLERRVGEVIGKEVRAAGGNYFGGVCMNIPYNPGWGRSQEVYGEDSMHMGKMAVSLVEGVQSQNVMACLKHYAFNSMENKRFDVNVTASKRTEQEVYLRHFKQAIDEGGAASVMASYNQYGGDYNCENKYLLTDVLRDQYGFSGFVISDFFFGLHNTAKAIKAGLNVEYCFPRYYSKSVVKRALRKGQITEADIDKLVLPTVRTLLAFSAQKDPQKYPKKLGQCKEHVALAEEVALKSMTLLKNNNVLPYKKSPKSVLLLGDLANFSNIGDHGSSWIMRANADTVYEAATERFGKKHVTFLKTEEVAKNQKLLEKADVIIAVAGLKHDDEGEFVSKATKAGGDRVNGLGLHKDEIKMLKGLKAYQDKTTAVLIGGNTLMLDPWFDSVGAVMMAYYPGVRGGHAIVDTLFGDSCPGGKLPYVTPKKESDLPRVNWEADEWHYEYYHGYRKLDKEGVAPKLPYGYGLSYTTFALSGMKLKSVNASEATFRVTVKNTGKMKGGEAVQLYVAYPGSKVDRPVKSLMDFEKVYLKPSESKTVELKVKKSDLAFFNETTNAFEEEDLNYIACIGTDSANCMKNKVPFKFK